ncbi:aldehyde dehydrogenase [Bradyrhizobium liaoningense]
MTEKAALFERVKLGRFLIDGDWLEAGDRRMFEIVTPSSETVFARVPCAKVQDIDAAVDAARRAFENQSWSGLDPRERGKFLLRFADAMDEHAELFAQLWTSQVGGLIAHGVHLVYGATAILRDFGRMAETFDFIEPHAPTAGGDVGMIIYEPVGVVGAIIPWNSPVLMLATKLGAALLAGCTVVVKMSPEAPLEGMLVGEILQELGLPAGVVNVLMADREESEALVRNPQVDKISFTGSSAAGQHIASLCGARMARGTFELGGKSAAVVMNDSPLDLVVQSIVPQVSMLTMQVCAALSRVIVPYKRHDELVERLAKAMRAIKVGDPFASDTQMGPMAMKRQLERVESYIESGKSDGFQVAAGGGRPAHLNRGFYIEPTLFAGVENGARIAQEEIFGPVICVIPARDEDHAISLANTSDFGLNSSVFTADPDRALAAARKLRAGTVGHNAFRSDFGIGFGGYKKSGIGREGGRLGLMPYLEPKTVVMETKPSTLA